MAFAAGTRLGRYEILAPLGKGGMGEVYRAKDTQLGREVAIKVLPEHLANDSVALKRFEREAMAVAALSHPNILNIHDSGTDQGVAYAVMEFLTGETLRSRLNELSMRRSIEIATAIAEGLAAAHAKGVIHRDLKPENIFLLKDGRVKILDFGLARQTSVVSPENVTEAPTKSQLTEMGSVMGTVPYMSPEQVNGESLDARSDIFSLGSILYEMLAGKKPFSGKSPAETMAAILKDEPAPLQQIPGELQRIVERCLAKDPDERFHSAHDLAFSLKDVLKTTADVREVPPLASGRPVIRKRAIAVVVVLILATAFGWWIIQRKGLSFAPAEKIQSIAVLPLTNLSGDAKQEYFADGMTEELIAKLARIASLRVISRTSVMEYKNARKPLPQIAKELNVDAIVEGSVLQAGDRVRITAQLIHAGTDRHLWANSYERDLRDILSLQNEVASAIAKEVQIKLAPDEAAQLASAPQVNPQAYEAYLRGLSYSERELKEENTRLSIEMYQRAVDLDPDFALAWAALSRAQSFYYFGFQRNRQQLAKAKESIDRALQLQPGFPEGHIALGYYYYWGFRDYDRAQSEWSVAEKKLPNNKLILNGTGAIFRRQGKFEQSLAAFHKLLAIDPRSAPAAFDLGFNYFVLRRHEEAERYFDLSISLKPDEGNSYGSSALNYLGWTGDVESARAIIAKAPDKRNLVFASFVIELFDRKYDAAIEALSSPYMDPLRSSALKGMVYRLMNNSDLARSSLEAASAGLEERIRKTPEDQDLHILLGLSYAGLGRKEDAIREGKRAVELLPVSKDALWGPDVLEGLAIIYTLVGEKDAALDRIEYLLSIPSRITVARLRLDPRFDPLRDHLRFQKLLAR
jgi:eukaryotic-like serine/threonine-protein kinase